MVQDQGNRVGEPTHIKDLLQKVIPPMNIRPVSNDGTDDKGLEMMPYNCGICHDSHFVHPRKPDNAVDYSRVVPCRCFEEEIERKRHAALLEWCELPAATNHMTFGNFTPKKIFEELLAATQNMAEGKYEGIFLTLMGDTDRGKTHLAIAICRRWLERGEIARYAYVPILMDELRRGFREGGDGSYEERWERFLNVPLLVLDDLGVENSTAWVQERLDTLVDYRLVNGLYTVVTTNLVMDELSVRIASRLQRGGRIMMLTGPAHSAIRGKSVK